MDPAPSNLFPSPPADGTDTGVAGSRPFTGGSEPAEPHHGDGAKGAYVSSTRTKTKEPVFTFQPTPTHGTGGGSVSLSPEMWFMQEQERLRLEYARRVHEQRQPTPRTLTYEHEQSESREPTIVVSTRRKDKAQSQGRPAGHMLGLPHAREDTRMLSEMTLILRITRLVITQAGPRTTSHTWAREHTRRATTTQTTSPGHTSQGV